ncbi:unnamed protein product [Coffea canephora]|uniref:Pectinesterase n=1 Tax=Coffea canephora TaxID=49390 RepID=A0A068UZ94_COFCA|nr:unnamed protein product [Coffea canephora]
MGDMALNKAILFSTLLFIPLVLSDNTVPAPADKAQLNSWFEQNVQPLASRKDTLDPALVAAEANPRIIKLKSDGSGEFKTIADAINSIPNDNTNRVIISLGPGNYTEKIKIERNKPFITIIGDPNHMPTLVFGGTAAKYGTVESATLIVESDYFNAANLILANSAPRPNGDVKGAQALAVRIGGDKASFYNCKFLGFQDTLCDDKGKHLFKDCYIEGTVDFIFGNGKSIYLNVELHVIPGDRQAWITAQARHTDAEDTGYSFVHCKVTGTGRTAYLGRTWMPYGKVVFAYTDMSDAVIPAGWSNNFHPETEKTVLFGEFSSTGPGSDTSSSRAAFTKKLTEAEVKPFLTLGFIEASKWLLPPTQVPA